MPRVSGPAWTSIVVLFLTAGFLVLDLVYWSSRVSPVYFVIVLVGEGAFLAWELWRSNRRPRARASGS
jgi:heme O synthase-like polyprenyltransferase